MAEKTPEINSMRCSKPQPVCRLNPFCAAFTRTVPNTRASSEHSSRSRWSPARLLEQPNLEQPNLEDLLGTCRGWQGLQPPATHRHDPATPCAERKAGIHGLKPPTLVVGGRGDKRSTGSSVWPTVDGSFEKLVVASAPKATCATLLGSVLFCVST